MESYDILANQPVVIDNVSMMMSFIHTQTEAASCYPLASLAIVLRLKTYTKKSGKNSILVQRLHTRLSFFP